MHTTTTRQGEEFTKWKSHKHPDNANYMQFVNWYVWVKKDGSTLVGYNLGSNGETHFIYNLTKEQAIEKYTDKDSSESVTEQEYQEWLANKK